jgi:hypothetical protein
VESNLASFENAVLTLTLDLIGEYSNTFTKLRLRVDVPEVIRVDSASQDSELRVYFWVDGSRLFDAIEFFLVRGGQPSASREDIKAWLRETLHDVVKRRQKALGACSIDA